jgi:site-specific DNA recombinase
MQRTIIYTRVSTQDQAESGLGLEAQETECRKYADRFNLDIVSVYTDSGISGAADLEKRPELLNALAALKRGDMFLVYKLDRLSRDVGLNAIIERELIRKGASLRSVSGEGTAADNDDLGALLQRRIVSMFAEYERKLIQARTKQALKAKRARGEYTGGSIPFGYDVKARGSVQVLIPNQAEQKTIAEIMEMRADKTSIRKIVNTMNTRKAHGKRWHIATIQGIVKRHSTPNYWNVSA